MTQQSSLYALNVFSIAPGADFLATLVKSLMNGDLIEGYCPDLDPLLLPDATIYVPNRRAARALSSAFLAYFEGRPTLLPAIRTLGDVDDNEFGLTPGTDATVPEFERLLVLARLVQSWKDRLTSQALEQFGDEEIAIPTSQADSIRMASDLTALLSQMAQEDVSWEQVEDIVPDDHADWWRLTSSFLQIVVETWPQYLIETEQTDPTLSQIKHLYDRVRELEEAGSNGPVIVAGSTGSVTSTQAMLKAVAGLSNGAVVLPGIDFHVRENEWERLSNSSLYDDPLIESQPQFTLARTLAFLGIDREHVKELGSVDHKTDLRNKVVSVAMSLSDFSADWHQQVHRFDEAELQQAFLDVCLIEATNERQEALAVAIAMREVLETPGKTAALVTPDRNLSRRVSMELMRYGIRVDDSAGVPLANTSAAVFIRQLLELVFTDCDKPNLTSLNKNPLTTLGFPIEQSGKLARQFEVIALRGTIHTPQPGAFVGFLQDRQERLASEKHVSSLIRQLTSDDWQAQFERCKRLDQAFEPLIVAKASEEEAVSLRSLAEALRKTVLSLTRLEGKASTFTNAHGAPEIDRLLEDMTNGNSGEYSVPIREVPRVFDALLAGKVCRSGVTSHSRLHILGPLEVRLQNYDRVILSGLNEDTWPRSLRNDIFINRSMRRQIGLPSPERRTGLAAHDFQQLIGKSEVVLSRSGRVDKAPTVASRWVQRLLALIGPDHAKHLKQRGNAYLAYAEELDRSETQSVRASRAEACPPVAARPKSLAVTDIESWIRDPYALYAKKVLRLSPVDPLEREPDALLKGTIYHAVMEEYVLADYSAMPAPERASILIGLAEKYLEAQNLPSDVQKLWQLRFGNVARAFVMWEDEHFSDGRPLSILTEVEGKVPLADGAFELRARADRLELNAESVHVLDYKTGNSPTTKQARSLSPQLALEGLIAQEGGFEGLPARPVGDLSFIRLREGDKFRVESIEVRKKTETVPVQEIIQSARESLEALVAAYQNSSQTYISRFAPFQEGEMGNDYDHLARTREWSFGEDGDDDE